MTSLFQTARSIVAIAVVCAASLVAPADASLVIVNNDEWTLSNSGFSAAGAANATNFARNIASAFSGGGPGNFLIYSNNFGLLGSNFATALTSVGHVVTTQTNVVPLTPALLSSYDGIFLGGLYPNAASLTALSSYVAGGGNLYIVAGTGSAGAVTEANTWNTVLNPIGLNFQTFYNGVGGAFSTTGFAHSIFAGVSQLYFNNGNTVTTFGVGSTASIYGSTFIPPGTNPSQGLFGIYETNVPAPAALTLIGFGLLGLGLIRRC